MYWNTFVPTIAFFAISRDVQYASRGGAAVQKRLGSTSMALEEKTVDASKYTSLIDWLKSNDAEINEKIEIRPSDGCGFGAFVTSDVETDELLFTVPRKACLTLNDATSDPNCGEAFTNLIEKAGPGGNTVVMAGYMAKEYLVLMEDIKNGRDVSKSRWGPYFETLPWERGTNNQEHLLFWSDEMVEELLEGSLCYGEATSLRDEVSLATRVMNAIVGKSIRVARGEEVDEGGFSWPWEAKPPPPDGPPEGLSEAINGAFVCLLTRAFQDSYGSSSSSSADDEADNENDDDSDEEKLVPMLDMLQHSETPNVRHAMRKVDGTVEVRARRNIEAGEELFNQYRSEEEENMPYSRFFTRFGFVPGILEPMVNLLEDKSSIFYPQKAEI